MSSDLTNSEIISKLGLAQTQAANDELSLSETTPASLSNADIKKVITVLGITPDDFVTNTEFNFSELMETFNKYCKDYNDQISSDKVSQALDFSAKMIYELGPHIRNEKKSMGVKCIRFRFPDKTDDGSLRIKTVLVTKSKEMTYKKIEEGDKMTISFRQAALLAMVTFTKAATYLYTSDGSILMTPLCRAVFSTEAIPELARELNLPILDVITMINESTCSSGQYLPNSDLACAIVGIITATNKVTNVNVKNHMINKLIKEYSTKHKVYTSERFNVFAKYALEGVPPGMDAETLIQNYSNIHINKVNLRAQVLAFRQSEVKVSIPTLQAKLHLHQQGTMYTMPPGTSGKN